MKIAYGAGHRLETPGKCFPAEIDKAQTKEWTVNDRVARYFADRASQYDKVELLRVDDPEGHAAISVAQRCQAANAWGADFCLSIHHNAGAKLTKAGGIVAFVCNGVDGRTKAYQKALYDACVAATGLKGNRATPLATADYEALTSTKAPAVLVELGFMDSIADGPIILTDDFSRKAGYALMDGIAQVAGLKIKQPPELGCSAWAEDAALWAISAGLVKGGGTTEYGWKDPITLERFITILHRFSQQH